MRTTERGGARGKKKKKEKKKVDAPPPQRASAHARLGRIAPETAESRCDSERMNGICHVHMYNMQWKEMFPDVTPRLYVQYKNYI